jgi:hypothetical protein
MAEQRRSTYRLVYPKDDRPTAVVNNVQYSVLDVSEGGMLLALPAGGNFPLSKDLYVSGSVEFGDRGTFPIAGYVDRIETEAWAIRMVRLIPMSHLVAEQTHFMKRRKAIK